jgi:predicted Zn-dependent peptidase
MAAEDLLTFRPNRSVVDGVPVYSSGFTTGPHTIAIMFRVGVVDETLGRRGVTHLVEHLALQGLRGAPYPFNGMVRSAFTVFAASGSPDELVAFVAAVCHALRNLPLDRLRQEIQVLTTEGQERPAAVADRMLLMHCGYTRYGCAALPELGLARVREADVAGWAAAAFTRENAAVWIAGSVPEGLAINLPAGTRFELPEPTQVESLGRSVWVPGRPGHVVLSALTEWSLALQASAGACHHRLLERLRFDKGISYAPKADVNRLTVRTGHWIAAADSVPTAADQATAAILDIVSKMAADGPLESDLAPGLEAARRAFSAPESIRTLLDQWTCCELCGSENKTMADLLDEVEALDRREVAAATSRALEAAVLVVPEGCAPSAPGFHPRVRPPSSVVRGRTFSKQPRPFFAFGGQKNEKNYVAINKDAVSLVDCKGVATTLYFNACAGLLKYREGRRLLLGDNGVGLEFVPREWPDGAEIASLLDAAMPDERIILC